MYKACSSTLVLVVSFLFVLFLSYLFLFFFRLLEDKQQLKCGGICPATNCCGRLGMFQQLTSLFLSHFVFNYYIFGFYNLDSNYCKINVFTHVLSVSMTRYANLSLVND
ncbi:hypothetical protein V6Z12_D05G332700 [Gossypium hirsutum]